MTTIAIVSRVADLNQREYTDRNGQQQIIQEREVWFRIDNTEFMGRMTGPSAVSFNGSCYEGHLCQVDFDLATRKVEKEGRTSHFTDVKVQRVQRIM